MRNLIKQQEAFSLVEAVVALAIVGVAMIVITQVSLATLKQARKNELQEVAVQSAVEAMDFVKQPSTLDIYGELPPANPGLRYYKFDVDEARLDSNVPSGGITGCPENSDYLVASLFNSGYTVCQQVSLQQAGTSQEKWNIVVRVVWLSVNGEYEQAEIKGYRIGVLDLVP